MAERITWTDRLANVISTVLRLSTATLVALVVVPPATVGVAVATLIYGPLPAGKLPDEKPAITAEPSTVVDANGDEIAVFRRFDRTVPVTWDDIPVSVRQAVVAIEDQRFWQHNGIDYEGIGRAARINLAVGEVAQGGSTITQQYVKNVYLSREQTIERKVEEALLAIEVEKRMTKEDILLGYLTSSYFGDGAYGIGAAAEVYFGKPVSQLDLSESALLAGLVQAPTRLSPRNDLDAAESRRVMVLQAMLDQGYITLDQFQTEAARRLWPADSDTPATGPATLIAPRPVKGAIRFPYFVDWVEKTLVDQLGPDLVYTGGLRIETTIDPRLQGAAEQAVAKRLERTEYPVDMAMVSLEPGTGHVLAMVGGRDYAFSQVNLATGGTTGFQPGSSFKPFVLATALSQGVSPDTRYPAPGTWRVPGCQGDCTISNYDGAGHGNIPLREAMRASVNTVFAKLVVDVGVDNTVAMARSLGLERLDPNHNYGASLALGAAETSPLEMASAYGTFANRGVRAAPTGVLKVIDRDGNVIVDNTHPTGTPVLDQKVADNVTDVLTGVVERGTGKTARLEGRPVAGKTGTAQSYRAAWFVGYTPQVATAVWMGHADGQHSLTGVNGVRVVTGGTHPAIAWHDYMAVAMEGREVMAFPVPEKITPPPKTKKTKKNNAATPAPESGASGTGGGITTEPEPNEIGDRQKPGVLADNCGGKACQRQGVPDVPSLPEPEVPVTLPPASAAAGLAPAGPTSATTTNPTRGR